MKQATGGRVLARNTILNILGQMTTVLVAIIAIPFLIKGLGTDRFGVLALALMVLNYFILFDLGLGQALTKLVAERLGTTQEKEIPSLVWTALLLTFVLGAIGTLLVGLFSSRLVYGLLKIPIALQSETLHVFYLLAASLPIILGTTGLIGVLTAHQRFDLINAVRVPMVVFTYVGPLLVLPFSQSLLPVVAAIVASRAITCLVYLLLCFHIVPALRREMSLRGALIGPLVRFGSWLTVSCIVSPLMVYLDRFLIGALISVTAVAYYVTPYEAVTKLLLIPGAMSAALFPNFSSSVTQDRHRTALLFSQGVKFVFLAMFPITLITVTLADEILDLWLGSEFSQNSTKVWQWLAVGVFINSLGFIPFVLIQGAGRPDLTAKLHLAELPFYLCAVVLMIKAYGIEGAAVAWIARVTVDTTILFIIARQFLPAAMEIFRPIAFMMGTLLALAAATVPTTITIKMLSLLLVLFSFIIAAWFLILSAAERAHMQKRLNWMISSIKNKTK